MRRGEEVFEIGPFRGRWIELPMMTPWSGLTSP